MRRHAFFDHPGPIPMAHRGNHATATENSCAAIQSAVDLGYTYIETDIHVSADGVAILSHDRELSRTAKQASRISDLTWAELSTISLPCGSALARLDETLTEYPEVRFNLDAKEPRAVEAIARVIRQLRVEDRTCVGSFSHRSVEGLRELLPQTAHSASPREVAALRFAAPASLFRADAAMIPTSAGPLRLATRRLIDRAHDRFTSVHIWTVNQAPAMRSLLDMGVDGLMTDQAQLLKDVLAERSQW